MIKIGKNTIRRKNRNREFVSHFKESHPCADCGKHYPACVMDFDHLPSLENTKVKGIAQILHWSLENLIKEMEKCVLVCSNCHRIRTWIGRKKAAKIRFV